MQKITLIAAMARNRVIGLENRIPWHIPEDFAFFKQYTLGKPVIMGRKTWESLPRKPLPSRTNIVVSRQTDFQAAGAKVFIDLSQAIEYYQNAEEIIIMGGAQIYQQALPLATDLRLTEIALNLQGDTFFPSFSHEKWQEVSRQSYVSQEGIAFDFVHYSLPKSPDLS